MITISYVKLKVDTSCGSGLIVEVKATLPHHDENLEKGLMSWKIKKIISSSFQQKNGGGALVRRSQVAGGRANGGDGAILYLSCGPSVYSTATIPQLAEYFGALKADIAR